MAPSTKDVNHYEWRKMSSEEIIGWYSPSDLCVATHANYCNGVDLRDIKCRLCNSTTNLIESSGRIHLGYAIKEKQCIPPFADRTYLFKIPTSFPDPQNKELLLAAKSITNTNRILVFMGDSVMGQTYESFFAEIYRQDSTVQKLNKNEYYPFTRNHSVYADITNNGGEFDIIQFKDISNPFFVIWLRCVYVHGGGNTHFSATGNWNSSKIILEQLLNIHAGIILIANIGLWYNNRSIFNIEIIEVLNYLYSIKLNKTKQNTVFWRETTSQHFDQTTNGYFRTGPRYKLHRHCIPNGNYRWQPRDGPDMKVDWRNEDVHRIFQRYNFSITIPIIPMAAFTKPLHSLHVTRPRSYNGGIYTDINISHLNYFNKLPPIDADCTHYCWTPILWQETWMSISRAILKRNTYH